MSTEGPGNIPPSVPTVQPDEGKSPAPLGSKRGQGITREEPESSLLAKRQRKSESRGKPFSIASLTPIEIKQPSVSLARRLSSPGRLSGELQKTSVTKEADSLWSELTQTKPVTTPCPDKDRQDFPRTLQNIPEATTVKIDGNYVPHSRITFSDSVMGIAAMGPLSCEQTDTLFKTAIQENCVAIVNLTNLFDYIYSYYPPIPGKTRSYGEATVTSHSIASQIQIDGSQNKLSVKMENKSYTLQYFWLACLPSHHGGNPDELLKLANLIPEGKILVHCKNGTGRTAMFMLILELKRLIARGLKPEQLAATLKKLIQNGRQCRGDFLEVPQQLQTVLNAAGKMLGISEQELADLLNSSHSE